MCYTESQVRDLLHLRRLYYGKMGQLYRQRKELRSQVPLACMGEVESICATDNYTLLSSLAEKLRVNAAEEYSVFVQSFCAIFRGVSLIPRLAMLCNLKHSVFVQSFCANFRGVSSTAQYAVLCG